MLEVPRRRLTDQVPRVRRDAPPPFLTKPWTSSVRTRTGVEICIRPLRPDDREREIAFVSGLSDRSRYFRLLTPLKFLPPYLLDQFMDVDYRTRMAFVATVERDGIEEFVGIARYGEADEPGTVELGITVADACQRTGIARLLVRELMRYAAWCGYNRMTGIVLPDNASMLALAKSLGFKTGFDHTEHLMTISRALTGLAPDLLVHKADTRKTPEGCGEVRVSGASAVH